MILLKYFLACYKKLKEDIQAIFYKYIFNQNVQLLTSRWHYHQTPNKKKKKCVFTCLGNEIKNILTLLMQFF